MEPPLAQDHEAIAKGEQDWTRLDVPMEPYRFARRRLAGWRPKQRHRPDNFMESFAALPRHLDWRQRINVAGPMPQGDCNACTSFAFAGVMTDLATIKVGHATPLLSPGHFHCCVAHRDCGGGLDPNDAAKAAKATAVATQQEGDYPFNPMACPMAHGVVRLLEAYNLTSFTAAIQALQDGPIVGVMDLYDDFWRYYGGGIYRRQSATYLNRHTIALIGYDADDGCWIVRNSRGTGWGEQGFARIAFNECRIFTSTGNWGLQLVIA